MKQPRNLSLRKQSKFGSQKKEHGIPQKKVEQTVTRASKLMALTATVIWKTKSKHQEKTMACAKHNRTFGNFLERQKIP